MGLFSSKSSSSSKTTVNYSDQSTDLNNASTIGSASSDNKVLGTGSTYNEQGLTGDNLSSVLDYSQGLYDKAYGTLDREYNILSQTISSVQKSAEKAIDATGDAYAESKNDFRNIIDGVKPIAFYATLAAIVYFIFKR